MRKSKKDNPLTKASLMYLQAELYYHGTFGTRRDIAKAVECYQQAANLGMEEAIMKLARLYYAGEEVAEDRDKAHDLYAKAAAMGNAEAMYYAAISAKDDTEFMDWCMRSAENGYGRAQIKIALLYQKGEYLNKNEEEAFRWFKRAADNGDMEAQYFLACCYSRGMGTKKDDRKAVEYWRRGAKMGEVFCIATLNMYEIPF